MYNRLKKEQKFGKQQKKVLEFKLLKPIPKGMTLNLITHFP